MKTTLKLAGAASILAMAVASTTAVAVPVLRDFLTFNQNAGWLSPAIEDNTGDINLDPLVFSDPLGGSPFPAGTFGTMSWSDTDNHPNTNAVHTSSIDILSYDDTNSAIMEDGGVGAANQWNQGEYWAISSLLQTNNVLHADGTVPNPLWIVDTLSNLNITDDDGSTVLLADSNSQTTIEFWETTNQNDPADCASVNPLNTGCDDIFRVKLAAFAPIGFDLDGYHYTIAFDLAPGPSTPGPATSLVCTAAGCSDGISNPGVPADEVWVFTPEENPGTSSLFVTAAWSAELIPVPEPSVLALFGIGILGLGYTGRRRKQG